MTASTTGPDDGERERRRSPDVDPELFRQPPPSKWRDLAYVIPWQLIGGLMLAGFGAVVWTYPDLFDSRPYRIERISFRGMLMCAGGVGFAVHAVLRRS